MIIEKLLRRSETTFRHTLHFNTTDRHDAKIARGNIYKLLEEHIRRRLNITGRSSITEGMIPAYSVGIVQGIDVQAVNPYSDGKDSSITITTKMPASQLMAQLKSFA